MSMRTKWIGAALVLLGMVIGAQYVRAAVNHHGFTSAATSISPEELTRAAGPLPGTVVESYI